MSRRRRLVTPFAVLLVLLGIAGLTAWGLTQGSTMFSPGGLNSQTKAQTQGLQAAAQAQPVTYGGVSTHAALGKDCGACHTAPFTAATMSQKCRACHTEVQTEMSGHTGIHGKILASSSIEDCGGCHTEHHGAAGQLTVLDRTFPHDLTGFVLRGAHQNMECTRCHGQDITTFSSTTCVDCHQRIDSQFMTQHIANFGKECVPCHTGREERGRNFDHSTFAFKLTGAHTALSCDSCHKGATTLAAFKDTPQDCYSCHAKNDAHQGSFGKDCAGCHSTTDWKKATFDHSKTSFPLTGAHVSLICSKCHVGATFTGLSADCASCHAQPDFHKDAFASQSTQCASCHATTAWTPATFTLAHTAFPVDHGSREQTSTCKTCHTTTVSAYTCFGCHAHTPDNVVAEHEGLTLAELQDCVRCHAGGRGGD